MNTMDLFQDTNKTGYSNTTSTIVSTLASESSFLSEKRINVAIYTIIDQTEITFSIESCTAQRIFMRSSAIANWGTYYQATMYKNLRA